MKEVIITITKDSIEKHPGRTLPQAIADNTRQKVKYSRTGLWVGDRFYGGDSCWETAISVMIAGGLAIFPCRIRLEEAGTTWLNGVPTKRGLLYMERILKWPEEYQEYFFGLSKEVLPAPKEPLGEPPQGYIYAQMLYDLREATGFCSGTDLHDLFRSVCSSPSPSGDLLIVKKRLTWYPLGEDALRLLGRL